MTPPSATMIHQSSGKIISFMTPGRKVAFGSDIEYIPCFIESEMATSILKKLVDTTQWSQPELNIFGRTRKVPRLAAWYGDQGAIYCYSRLKNKPLEWNSSLLILKELVEKYVKTGKVRMLFKDFIIIGPDSKAAALSAHCAGEQGKFW